MKSFYVDIIVKLLGYFVMFGIMLIPVIFIYSAIPLFEVNSISDLFFSGWDPQNKIFGLRNFILTSLIITFFSTIISFIMSLSISLFIYENRKNKFGMLLERVISFLSGVPTVVYGFIGVILLVPFIRTNTPSPTGFSLLAVIMMLSILIMPTITLYINQSFNSLPDSIKNACLSLGATKSQFYFYILIPQSLRGIIIALIMGFSRALSDTILALMISGNAFKFPNSFFESSRALTAHIALTLPGEFDGIEFKSIFLISLILGVFILIFNLIIHFLEKK